MKNLFFVTLIIFFSAKGYSQFSTEGSRLASLDYMKKTRQVNCDSTSGTSIEERICLNLQFQKIDSKLNLLFDEFLQAIEVDSIRNSIIEYQKKWIDNRNNQGILASKGLEGNSKGIYYLRSMVITTNLRLQDLEEQLKMKE